MTETKFGAWSPPGAPVAVEYSLAALDEIRQAITEGFQKFSRGGIEVGGVLYGTREHNVTRILAVRGIACEHSIGPSFQLSDNDKHVLREQMERDRSDERLYGFVPVGWYLSHTRGEINLTLADLALYAEFFPEPYQITMVAKPARGGSMRAGFFVREATGAVVAERSYQEFALPDRVAGALDRPPRDRAQADRRPLPYENLPIPKSLAGTFQNDSVPPDIPGSMTPGRELAVRDFSPQDDATQQLPAQHLLAQLSASQHDAPMFGQYDTSAPRYQPYPDPGRSWSWVWVGVLVLAVAVSAVFALRMYGPQINPDPLALTVVEREGQLQIQWSHASRAVLGASSGELDIVDGQESHKFQLTSPDLARGNFTYVRKSGDVEVRMEVRDSRGTVSREASRFVGSAPSHIDTAEADALKTEQDALQDEVTRLRSQNGAQAARIQQLERTLTILQTRLNVSTEQR